MKFTTETIGTVFGIVFQDHVTKPFERLILKDKASPLIKLPIFGKEELTREFQVFDLAPEEALSFAQHLNKRVKVTTTYELLEDEPAEVTT